jgi:mannose-1-phosphate guanylyltransferase/mannose-6-phosphate isomerase
LAELGLAEGDLLAASRAALAGGRGDLDFFRLDARAFNRCRKVSIDVAVMERTAKAAVIPVDMGWSDVGSWSALWRASAQDAGGNVLAGNVVAPDATGSYIRSEGPPVVAIGVRDLVVVATGQAMLVIPRERAESLKNAIDALKARGWDDGASNAVVHRPWGAYRTVLVGERFLVKTLSVKPGAKLSLQSHRRRAEHWVIVRGTARVTCGGDISLLKVDESAYIPVGAVHRLENPTAEPLELIEVQSGPYIGEDDIVRLEDDYGRIRHEKEPSPEVEF